jgi:tRNA(Ile)-lysidine synthase
LTEPGTTPLILSVRRTVVAWGCPSAGDTIVVALSGGPDSVALADAMTALGAERGFTVVLAHLDHGLRPTSGEDASFCEALATRLGVPIRVGRADVRARAAADHGGLEEAARRERYLFLEAVRQEAGARFIVVGHTKDDQAETLLLRLLRGAGVDGLASMRPRSGALLRPLLSVSRREVVAHLSARGLPSRHDATNDDVALLRNRVRHELLPYLESRFNPEVRETLARTAELLADDADALESHVERVVPEVARRDGACCVLSLEALSALPVGLARRVLRRGLASVGGLRGISARHVENVRALAAAGVSGRWVPLPGRRVALVSFGELRIGPSAPETGSYAFPLAVPGLVQLPGGVTLRAVPAAGPQRADEATAVVAAPADGLIVRTRRAGDRVWDGGRDISLKRFLMRHRVPTSDRSGLPLVAAGDRVLWIPGQKMTPAPVTAARCVQFSIERSA